MLPLHLCPLYPHGTELGSTPLPESAPCPDMFVPEVWAVALGVLAVGAGVGVLRRRLHS